MFIRTLIQERFNSRVKVYDREGIEIEDQQLKKEYHQIRQYILDLHSSKHDCVAISIQKDYRYMLIMLACMEIGVPYVPLKDDYPLDRINQIQEDARFTLLLDAKIMEKILGYEVSIEPSLPAVSSENVCYTMFTSGTSGRPKGVVIQRKALENFFKFMDAQFPHLNSADRVLQVTEFTFDISLVEVAFFLTKNLTIYFSGFTQNVFRLAYELDTYKINVLNTVPNNLNMLLSDAVKSRTNLRPLKYILIGGARFSYGLYQKCLENFNPGAHVYNMYGPTESTVYSHFKSLTFAEDKDCVEGNISIGKPLPGVKSSIVINGKVQPPFTEGELYIGGKQLMREYVNRQDFTLQALVELKGQTYYRSGDLAFKNDRDEYFIVGRVDDTVKRRGFRVNLQDIDSYVTRLPYVQDSVTVALQDDDIENKLICFIILKEKKEMGQLRSDLKTLLLDYQIPEVIIFIDKYPVNNSGKVCRNTLKKQYLEFHKA